MAAKYPSKKYVTAVLIGGIGSGKSCTGNTIIGSLLFKTVCSRTLVTREMEYKRVNIEIKEQQLSITVIDTPGIQNLNDFLKLRNEVQSHKCGICVFLFVIPIGRFKDKKLLEDVLEPVYGIYYRTGIVLTNTNELKLNKQSVDEWLRDTPSLVKLIGDKNLSYVAIENQKVDEQTRQCQREKLFLFIDGLSKKTKPVSCMSTFLKKLPLMRTTPDSQRKITVTFSQLEEKFGEAGVNFFNDMKKLL